GSPALAARSQPQHLSPAQLDPVTGEIAWAPALAGPEYAPYRQQIDSFFARRAQHLGGTSAMGVQEVRSAAGALMDELNKHIDTVQPQQWVDAKQLIAALQMEAASPTM